MGGYGIILDQMITKRSFLEQKRTCIPGYTLNADGSFKCGDVENGSWTMPFITLSVGAPESFLISVIPFMLLIPFNIIYFNIFKPKTEKNMNTSIIVWFLNILRVLGTASGISTIIIHILKYTIGLPRPNTYSILNGNKGYPHDAAFESFPSGHIAIGFVNCYIFCIMAQNSLEYSMKRNYVCSKVKEVVVEPPTGVVVENAENDEEEVEEEFTGHHWFFLPIWNKLKYVPTIAYILVWLPMAGATYIGITRIREYWHSDIDCVTGALIGIATGHISYKRYYYEFYGIE